MYTTFTEVLLKLILWKLIKPKGDENLYGEYPGGKRSPTLFMQFNNTVYAVKKSQSRKSERQILFSKGSPLYAIF